MKNLRHKGSKGQRHTDKKTFSLGAIIFSLCSMFYGLCSSAFASHNWPMFRGDSAGSGNAPSTLTLPLTAMWNVTGYGEVISSPVKYKNKICFGSRDKNIYCLNAFTGQILWQYATSGWVDATPAAATDVLYVGSRGGKFYALDINTGALKWQFDTGTGGVIASSAVIVDSAVYFGSATAPGSALYALNKDSGGLLWKVDLPQPVYSSPVVTGNTLLVGDNRGKLLAFDRMTGAQSWMFSSNGGHTFFSSPSISADGATAYFAPGYYDKKIYAVNISSGTEKWQYDTALSATFIYVSSPVSGGGKVFFAAGNSATKVSNLYALNENTGALLWQASLGDPTDSGFLSTPFISGNNVYQATGNGKLYAYDVTSGAQTVTLTLGDKIFSSPMAANGMVFSVTAEGKAYAYRGEDGGTMPSVSITVPASGQTINKTFNVTGTASDTNLKDYSLYYGAGASPSSFTLISTVENTVDAADTLLAWNTATVPDGQYTLKIVATDLVGNQSNVTSASFFIDNTPPLLSVTQPANNLLTISASVTVQGTTDAGSLLKVNGTSVSLDAGGNFSYDFALTEGQNTITVESSDAVGNTNTTVRTVTKDTQPPLVTLNAPVDNLLTNSKTVTASGTTELGAIVTVNGASVTLDPQGNFSTVLTLSEGTNTITVVAKDTAQNSQTVTRTVTVDTIAPSLSVTAPVDGAITNHATLAVTGTAETGSALTVNGTSVAVDAQGNYSASVALSEGSNTITVEAKDTAGNKTTLTRTVTKDTNSPQISITSPTDNLITTQSAVTVSGSTKIGSTVAINGTAVSVDAQGNFSTVVNLNEGSNAITISVTDTAGNTVSVSRTVTKDTTAPALTLTAPSDNTITNQTQISVTGATEAGITLKVNASVVTVKSDGNFEAAVTLSEGKNALTAEASDGAGNTTTLTRTVTLDTKPPSVTLKINSGSVYTDKKDVTVTLTASDNDGGTGVKDVMLSEDADFKNASWVSFTPELTLTLSSAFDKKTVYLKVKDAAGNESAKASSFIEYVSYVSASVDVNASQLVGDDKTIKIGLTLPQNLAGSIQVIFAEAQNVPSVTGRVGKAMRLRLLFSGTVKEKEVTQSDTSAVKTVARVQLSYADSKTLVSNENNLRIYVLSSSNAWTKLSGFQEVSADSSEVSAQTPLILNKEYTFALVEENTGTAVSGGTLKALNYPNPVHGDTTFSYALSDGIPVRVSIEVYTTTGKKVLSLEDPTPQDGKYTTAEVDALPNGIYVYRLQVFTSAKTLTAMGRLVMLR